ncbi:MAG: DUF3576 domain-containing protein [Alphaproteobacteria bacterium]
MHDIRKSFLSLCLCLAAAITLNACASEEGGLIKTEAKYPTGVDRDGQQGGDIYAKAPSIFGSEGLSFGGKKDKDSEDGSSGIAVNSFLWRASLDTVSFMPLASADPFGGVILTDWYTPAENADERFKLNVFILSRALRSDGVQVRVFKQVKSKGSWRDMKPSAETARQLEDTILTRARQLRVAQLGE